MIGPGGNPSGPTYKGYQKTEYNCSLDVIDSSSGEIKHINSIRTVRQRTDIDPDMIIPKGTRYSNGQLTSKDMTNAGLMKDGAAPFVRITDGSGNTIYSQVELHHGTMQETIHGSSYFTGKERDGAILEIPSSIHRGKGKSGVLHISGTSFRKDFQGKKSMDEVKYEKFKKQYWKDRLKQLKGE